MRNPPFRYIFPILITFILSLWCSGAYAYQVGTTSVGAEIKWNTNDAAYYINTSGGPADSLAAIQAAMQTWTDVSTSSFNFNYGGTTSSTAYGTMDGTNIICFGTITTTGTVGQNSYWYYTDSGQLIDSDIKLNTYHYSWVTDGSINGFDVQNVTTHELGHSLSLEDLYSIADTEKTMYGSTEYGETKRRTLEQDDIDGITYLYPDATPTPSPSPIVTPSPTPTPTLTPTLSGCDGKAKTVETDTGDFGLLKQASKVVTVTVTDAGGCPVADKKVFAKINRAGKKPVKISPSSETTGENGAAAFTITAKKKTGKTKVTFKAGGVKEKITVTVVSE